MLNIKKIALAALVVAASSCATKFTGGVHARVENGGTYAEFRAGVQDPSIPYETYVSDPNLCYEIRFVGADGAVIETVGPLQGQSSGQVPPGTVRYEKVIVPCPEATDGPKSQAEVQRPDMRLASMAGAREMVLLAPFSVDDSGGFVAAYSGPIAYRYDINSEGRRSWNYVLTVNHDQGRVFLTVGCSSPASTCSLSVNGADGFPSTSIVWPNGFRSVTYSVPMSAFDIPYVGGPYAENAIAFEVNGWTAEVAYNLRADL